MKVKQSIGDRVFDIVNYSFFTVLSVIMFYPLWHQICLSLSTAEEASRGGFFFWPRGFEMVGYERIFGSNYVWVAFANSIFVTVTAVILTVLISCGAAYFLTKRELPGSKAFMIMLLIAFLFSAGTIPTYLIVKGTGLINSLWALIIPSLIAPYNIFIIRNFFDSLPASLEESAIIDGANYFQVFTRIILPLSKPVIATVSIWIAVGKWNGFMDGLLYLSSKENYILPLLVRDIIMGASDVSTLETSTLTNVDVINAATLVVATIPIMIVYPFLQKHFTKGIMLGGVKE